VPRRLEISPIVVWSLGARTAFGTLSLYAGTKGAIDTPAKYFATALGPHGILVNVIRPA
jgi:3-oxoacyl-[acyl-carrier protein] reductase